MQTQRVGRLIGMENQNAEVDRNFDEFQKMLPDLMKTSPGKWALLRHRKVVDVFDTSGEAVAAGERRYSDGRFSVQEVSIHPVSLGWFSGVPA